MIPDPGVGGTELTAAERAGRELIELAPYRENELLRGISRAGA
jgi:hypothetical protein